MTMALNGQSLIAEEANGFLSVSRVWQAGDKLELTLPAEVQVSRLPAAPNTVAFSYGPLVLSAGLGTASMTTAGHAWTLVATKPTRLQETITINGNTTINSWLANISDNLVRATGHSAAPAAGGDHNSTSDGAGRNSSVASNASGDSHTGCSCRLSDTSSRTPWSLELLMVLSVTALRRRYS